MKTEPIGELTKSIKTWNPSREPDRLFEYIDLSAVDNSSKRVTTSTTTLGSEAPSRARQLVAVGDVVVSTVRPNLNAVAVVPIELDGATASTGFTVLRPTCELDSRFLFHWVRSPAFISDMVRKATGASYPAVSDRIVKDSHIPRPPLAEQRRIAAILDHADALRGKHRQVLAHLNSLTQAIFNDMFGRDPLTTTLGALVDFYSGGTPSKIRKDYWEGDLPWFSAKDLKAPDLWDSQDHIASEVTRETSLRLLPPDTVTIVVRGMILAHTVPVTTIRVPATINQDLKALIPKANIDIDYLSAAIRARSRWILARVSTAAHGTKKLESAVLESIPVPHADSRKQRVFAARVAAVDAQRTAVSRAISSDDELLASLQVRAFRGEL